MSGAGRNTHLMNHGKCRKATLGDHLNRAPHILMKMRYFGDTSRKHSARYGVLVPGISHGEVLNYLLRLSRVCTFSMRLDSTRPSKCSGLYGDTFSTSSCQCRHLLTSSSSIDTTRVILQRALWPICWIPVGMSEPNSSLIL